MLCKTLPWNYEFEASVYQFVVLYQKCSIVRPRFSSTNISRLKLRWEPDWVFICRLWGSISFPDYSRFWQNSFHFLEVEVLVCMLTTWGCCQTLEAAHMTRLDSRYTLFRTHYCMFRLLVIAVDLGKQRCLDDWIRSVAEDMHWTEETSKHALQQYSSIWKLYCWTENSRHRRSSTA